MKKIKIIETALRDAHQSLAATRMTTEQMLPILSKMDEVGYYSIEAWGGATFDTCIRFLDEDPWERLRKIKKHLKKTKLQMLFRGQNILGYRHFSDNMVKYFVEKCVENGVEVLRVFDALNDIDNLKTSIKACVDCKTEIQAAISYTTGDIYTIEYYVEYAKKLEDLGVSSICVKDMSGLLTPYFAFDFVKALKENISVPIYLHSHYTSGLASMVVIKSIEAGIDGVDTAISPLSMGTSHMPTECLVAALKGTPYDTGIDILKLEPVCDYFKDIREEWIKNGVINPSLLGVDINILLYQVPGGMLSNLFMQLKTLGQEKRLNEILKEIPKVRADVGYIPLVTPSSQIVGTQAAYNILSGERYKMVTKEFKSLVRGEYGKTPVPIDEDFVEKILGDKNVLKIRPADMITENEIVETLRQSSEFIQNEEDILTYAQFPRAAKEFFKRRRDREK